VAVLVMVKQVTPPPVLHRGTAASLLSGEMGTKI